MHLPWAIIIDKRRIQGFNECMSVRLLLSAVAATAVLSLVSCSGTDASRITGVADLPLKSIGVPGTSWQMSPLRANAQYLLYGTNTKAQKINRIGDYYYVDWYDAEPARPAQLVMHYTQARTASQLFTRTIDYPAPRESTGTRKAEFFFNGKERRLGGDILTWRIELLVDGKVVDSRQSYLWE